MDNKKFGNFIKELRHKNNMTQKELAEKLNLTDKAISKWERGLGFPDITMLKSLAEIFKVDVSEILNGQYGKKENMDIDKAVNEAVEEIKKKSQKRKIIIQKAKKNIGIISLIIFLILAIMQCVYLIVLKRYEFEYIIDNLLYIINQIIIICGSISALFLLNKNNIKNIAIYIVFFILTLVNIAFMIKNTSDKKSIIDFSNNFSNQLVMKQDTKTGDTVVYKNVKLFIYARPKEKLSYEVKGDIKRQWLTNDICNVTYTDKDGNLREYVATYGDRGNGTSYYNVLPTLIGDWVNLNTSDSMTKLNSNNKGIIIQKEDKIEKFKNSDCKQFGTIALVLYKNDVPRYVVALNEDCKLDDKTDIIKKGGTISLIEVSMKNTILEKLSCSTYKDDNLADYNIVKLDKNEYKIKDGQLYLSYDGESITQVPGDFSNVVSLYNSFNYQISDYKTVFFNNTNNKRYLIYSDDMGKNWEKVELEGNSSIQNIHFVSQKIGFMLEFDEKISGSVLGKISKSTDGGKTWKVVNKGVGDYGQEEFKVYSQIYFIDEEIGFLTMPSTTGEYCKLYMSRNGGATFEKINIEDNQIYDYYSLPEKNDNVLTLKISQGSDGDYNGGDAKLYKSIDNGRTWSAD